MLIGQIGRALVQGTGSLCAVYGRMVGQFPCLRRPAGNPSLLSNCHASDQYWLQYPSSDWGKEMENILGLLKVHVIQGQNLAVRDLWSSDPYVLARLGDQTVKTRVIKRNLNPVWDDELTLSVRNPTPQLKLEVFDKDKFTRDELLGEAEVDLQPLVAATEHASKMNEKEIKEIARVCATPENGLVSDSLILLEKGQIVQHLSLNLKNAESGQIEIKLKWVPI